MAFPMTKITLTIISIWIVITFCETSVIVVKLYSIRVTLQAIMLIRICGVIYNRLAPVSFCRNCVWNFCYIMLPILMKTDHSYVTIESMTNTYLIICRCVILSVNFSESVSRKFIIKHWIHISQWISFKSSICYCYIMPFIVRTPPSCWDVILIELSHKVKSYSFYIHINSKHIIKPSPININFIDNLTHYLC